MDLGHPVGHGTCLRYGGAQHGDVAVQRLELLHRTEGHRDRVVIDDQGCHLGVLRPGQARRTRLRTAVGGGGLSRGRSRWPRPPCVRRSPRSSGVLYDVNDAGTAPLTVATLKMRSVEPGGLDAAFHGPGLHACSGGYELDGVRGRCHPSSVRLRLRSHHGPSTGSGPGLSHRRAGRCAPRAAPRSPSLWVNWTTRRTGRPSRR
jgi:hypothetical protein